MKVSSVSPERWLTMVSHLQPKREDTHARLSPDDTKPQPSTLNTKPETLYSEEVGRFLSDGVSVGVQCGGQTVFVRQSVSG